MPRKQKDGPEAGAVERLNAQTGEAAVAVVAAADAAQPSAMRASRAASARVGAASSVRVFD